MKIPHDIRADGIHDDWSAIQHMLDTQDTILLKRGIYRCTKPLVLKREGQILEGAEGAVLLYDAPCGEALRVEAKHICISKLVIQSSYDRESTYTYENIGIYASHAHEITLCDLQIYGFCTNLLLRDSDYASVLRCTFNQARIGGIEALQCRKLQIQQCHFLANGWMKKDECKLSGFCNTGVALRLENTVDTQLIQCIFLQNARALWAMHVHRLFGEDCIEENQVRCSLVYGDASFAGGSGFDDESIFIG